MDAGEKVTRLFGMGQGEASLQARDVLLALATGGVAVILALAVRMAYELGRMESTVVYVQTKDKRESDVKEP